jgi:hypothetical protein
VYTATDAAWSFCWFQSPPPKRFAATSTSQRFWADDGQQFHNPVMEKLPTIRELARSMVTTPSERTFIRRRACDWATNHSGARGGGWCIRTLVRDGQNVGFGSLRNGNPILPDPNVRPSDQASQVPDDTECERNVVASSGRTLSTTALTNGP